MVADIYNTTINVNGKRVFSSTYSPCGCCCGGFGMYPMNSCFGFGYGGFGYGLGLGAGYAAGMSLAPVLPNIFSAIGKGFSWLGTKVIAPAAVGAWKGISTAACWVGKGIAKGATAVAKGIAKGATAIATGISNLWKKIFHKKSKSD